MSGVIAMFIPPDKRIVSLSECLSGDDVTITPDESSVGTGQEQAATAGRTQHPQKRAAVYPLRRRVTK